jgi:DNA recombination protein RmuC
MQLVALSLGLVIGLILGALGLSLRSSKHVVLTSARAEAAERRVLELDQTSRTTGDALAAAQIDAATAKARLEEVTVSRAQDLERIQGLFAQLSQEALSQNAKQFMDLAQATLSTAKAEADAEISGKHQAIAQLLEPMAKQLEQYQELVRDIERRREGSYAELVTQVGELKTAQTTLEQETRNLVQALRAPQTRGRWGEMQLRRVVELAGMVDRVDFFEQSSTDTEDGKLRPDMVVHLPGGGTIVVDSKVPLQGFLEANEATTEADRKAALVRHAQHLRTHITQLADKAYWKSQEATPELVVCFIPGEPLANAAFEQDPGLMDFALSKHVIPATPANLITLLKTIQSNWHYDEIEEKAEKIAKLGTLLYERLRVVGDHMTKMQKSLTKTVEAFNDMTSSVESRLMVTARELHREQLISRQGDKVKEVSYVDKLPRPVQSPELLAGPEGELGA